MVCLSREGIMNRRGMLAFVSIAGLAFSLNSAVAQQTSLKDQLVGTWTLVTADAFGPNPRGTFILEPNGQFSAVLMRANVPKIASNNRLQGTPDEYKAIVDGTSPAFSAPTRSVEPISISGSKAARTPIGTIPVRSGPTFLFRETSSGIRSLIPPAADPRRWWFGSEPNRCAQAVDCRRLGQTSLVPRKIARLSEAPGLR